MVLTSVLEEYWKYLNLNHDGQKETEAHFI